MVSEMTMLTKLKVIKLVLDWAIIIMCFTTAYPVTEKTLFGLSIQVVCVLGIVVLGGVSSCIDQRIREMFYKLRELQVLQQNLLYTIMMKGEPSVAA